MARMSELQLGMVGEFMNLIEACERKGYTFDLDDGFTLEDCKEWCEQALIEHGYSHLDIPAIWSGEIQLTSS